MKNLLFIILMATVVFGACKKATEMELPRLFRPQAEQALVADSNTIVASWLKVNGAIAYEVQLSRDTFRTVDLALRIDTNVAVMKKLLYNQLYQVQVRALHSNADMSSRWANLGGVKTLSSILKVPGLSDITFNSVRVSWNTKGAPVTSIKILKTSDSSTVANVTLTAADLIAAYKVVNGLQAATKYTIFLYSGPDVRGYVDFSTKEPFLGSVIDLSGIIGRPSVLTDTLPLVPSGSTILLKRGEQYNVSGTFALSKSYIIMSAPDLTTTEKAKIYLTSNFVFAASAAIDSIEFNDVNMYGSDNASRYIINNTNGANVGKLKFVNSRMEIFRGMVRLQSGALNIGSFIIDNCIVDSIGNYFVLNVAASSKVDNVSITNSTFYKTEGIVSSAQTATSFKVDACTFNEAPLGNNKNYFFDYGSQNVTTGLNISNSIFGIGKSSGGAVTVKGFRAGAATTINTTNIYKTSDYVSGGNDIPNIIAYNRPATQLWQDPAAGNFKFIDLIFPGKNTCGDPRWR